MTFNLPRMASDTGMQLICDPGENYKMFPEMSRITIPDALSLCIY